MGPTVSIEEAQLLAPNTTVLPPVAHGDLLQLDLDAGDVVTIIDGYYYQRLPVRHKELVDCLSRGIVVIGAASMGALRAAEMDRYGMKGIGLIYKMYANNSLQGDDEVAVLHTSESEGFVVLAEALINIRATLRAAFRARVLDDACAKIMLGCAINLVFYRRTYEEIASRAVAAGGDPAQIAAFMAALPRFRKDVKRRDAIHALRATDADIVSLPQTRPPSVRTVHFLEWERQHRGSAQNADQASVASVVRMLGNDYPGLLVEAMSRWFAASTLTVAAGDDELVGQFWQEHVVGDPQRWLSERELTYAELAAALRARTAIEQLCDDGAYSDVDGAIHNRIRVFASRHGIGESALVAAGDHWLSKDEREELGADEAATRVVARSFRVGRALGVPDPLLIELKMSGRYSEARSTADAIRDFNTRLKQRRPDHDVVRLRPAVVAEWFLGKWVRDGDARGALAARGFRNQAEMIDDARGIFLYDKASAGTAQVALSKQGGTPTQVAE